MEKKKKQIRDTKDSIITYQELLTDTIKNLGQLTFNIFDGVCDIDGKQLYQFYSKINRYKREIENYYKKLDELKKGN